MRFDRNSKNWGGQRNHGLITGWRIFVILSIPAAELFFLFPGTLNLHKLPAETPFDAKIAVSDAVVNRRGRANDLAFLLVHGEVAAHAAVRTDGVSLRLTP